MLKRCTKLREIKVRTNVIAFCRQIMVEGLELFLAALFFSCNFSLLAYHVKNGVCSGAVAGKVHVEFNNIPCFYEVLL